MKTASRARDSRGFTSSHGSRLSIDPDHHVTEAIGDMYGEYIDEDGRRQSYVLPPDAYPNSSVQNRHSSVFSVAGKGGSRKDWSNSNSSSSGGGGGGGGGGNSRGNELLPGSPSPAHRSPSPSRSPSETANQFFPLNNTNYESDPAAVAQEISNLQALRRMSMDVTSTADPDLPSFNTFIPSTLPEDGADSGSVFWVPARLHPELAPKEFSAYLEAKKNEIRRDGSLSPDGTSSTSPGLRRKKSMLSRQVDHSEGAKGYRDGTEALGGRRSGKEGPPQLQLEDLMSDPNALMRRLSVERRGNAEGDMPILPASAPGAGLRRSTRTTYRRGSLRKGEKMLFSKRQARASETDTEDHTSPINGRPGLFGLQRVLTEPIPPIPSHFSGLSEPDGQSLKSARSANKKTSVSVSPSGSPEDLPLGGSTLVQSGTVAVEGKHKSAPAKQKRRASSPKGTSRSRASEPTPPVPRIIETPPPLEEPQKPIHPERHSSLETTPQKTLKSSKPQQAISPRTPGGSPADVVYDVAPSPVVPANHPKASELMPVPFTSSEGKDAKDRKRPDSAGSTGESSSTRKSSWGWLLGDSEHKVKDRHEKEKDEKREKDREEKNKVRKDKRPKSAEKSAEKHDNTRLDLLQKSIDLGNTGKVITADPVGVKTDEKHEKERKYRGEEKKEKESGGLLSFFGSSRKKSGGDGSHKQKDSSSRNPSPDPSREQPHQNFYYTRFPIHIERAIYRLSHLKLANPRRPLHQQVLLSNFMYSYLAKVQQTQPHLVQQATVSQSPSREERHREKQARESQHQNQYQHQNQQQVELQSNQYYQYEDASSKGSSDYVDDSQMYEYTDGSGNESDGRPQSRASRRDRQDSGNDNCDRIESERSEHNGGGGGGGQPSKHHSHSNGRGGGTRTKNHDKVGSDDMW